MLDLFNEEIVAYSLSTSPNMNLVLDMLEKAFKKFPKGSHPIIHSDQRFHYQNREYQRRLKHRGCIPVKVIVSIILPWKTSLED